MAERILEPGQAVAPELVRRLLLDRRPGRLRQADGGVDVLHEQEDLDGRAAELARRLGLEDGQVVAEAQDGVPDLQFAMGDQPSGVRIRP